MMINRNERDVITRNVSESYDAETATPLHPDCPENVHLSNGDKETAEIMNDVKKLQK